MQREMLPAPLCEQTVGPAPAHHPWQQGGVVIKALPSPEPFLTTSSGSVPGGRAGAGMARHRQGRGRRYGGSGRGRVPPSRRNRKNRRFSNKPLNKKKGEAERTVKRQVAACGIVITRLMLPAVLSWQGTCVSVPPTTTGKGDERAPTCLSIAVLCRGKQDQAPEHPRNKTSRNAKSSITRRPAPSFGGSTDMEKIPINPPGRSQGVMAFGVGDRGCD